MVFGRISADSGKTLARGTRFSPTRKMRSHGDDFKGLRALSVRSGIDGTVEFCNYQKELKKLLKKEI